VSSELTDEQIAARLEYIAWHTTPIGRGKALLAEARRLGVGVSPEERALLDACASGWWKGVCVAVEDYCRSLAPPRRWRAFCYDGSWCLCNDSIPAPQRIFIGDDEARARRYADALNRADAEGK